MNKEEQAMTDITTHNAPASIEDAIDSALKGSGKINVIIAGKTGVGKSTLINTIFRGDLAKTGSGRPVTQRTEEISKAGHPVTIIDTKGLELKDYDTIAAELTDVIDTRSHSQDENQHIHVAWLCIHEDGRRVEDAEIELCRLFAEKKIPVVVVITKSRSDNGFNEEVRQTIPSAAAVVSVRALAEELDDDGDSITLKPKGLDKLILETARLLPEAKKRAYANALSSRHLAATRLKIEQAEKEVIIAATAAGAVAAVPIPFSDAVGLVPIQVGMLAKIGITFGMEISTTALTTLVTSTLGAGAATLIGRTLVTGLLKMIPGAGSVVGGTIAAATATALTKALGSAYISVLTTFIQENPGKDLDMSLIAAELKKRISI
ncbi:GTPase [Halopseudomonas aestusnigri]|uniref:GTPase n=1 Tax=Halopseudomonas aestusnigri TaxID=857252 RepID=UPI0030C6A997